MSSVALISVYQKDENFFDQQCNVLYNLLKEREPDENISHKVLPGYNTHCDFVRSKPHKAWYIVQARESYYPFVGMVYLGKENNIGVGILKRWRRHGYARAAIKSLMKHHKEKDYYANINPNNTKSLAMFELLGFKLDTAKLTDPTQYVYRKSLFVHGMTNQRIKLRPLFV